MAVAGYCKACAQNVWLNDRWGCANGHPWTEISGWYDPDTGAAVTPYWLQPPAPSAEVAAPAPTPVQPTAREALLGDILAAFAVYPGYVVRYGTDTDVVIDDKVADANWGTGKKKVEYEAVLKAVEAERTVYFWEMLKEKGAGVSFGGFESESHSTFGGTRWGKKKEVVVGPGGVAADYEWDYAATRRIVEDVVTRHGWQMKVVLRKKSAQW